MMIDRLSPRYQFWIYFAVIIIVNLYIYWPSLGHGARADQLGYLTELSLADSFRDILSRSYSFTRSRVLDTGDQWLFRPLFYFFLSVEKFLFGYYFVAWQAAGIFLHLSAMGFLLKLALDIRNHPLVFLGVFYVSVLFLGSEMVIWYHISAYMAGMILFLGSLLVLRKMLFRPDYQSFILWGGLLAAACFINEFFVFLVPLTGLLLWTSNRKEMFWSSRDVQKLLLVCFTVCFFYVLASLTDFLVRAGSNGNLWQSKHGIDFIFERLIYFIPGVVECLAYSVLGFLLPMNVRIGMGNRNFLLNDTPLSLLTGTITGDVWSVLNLVLFLLLIYAYVKMYFHCAGSTPQAASDPADLWKRLVLRISFCAGLLYVSCVVLFRGSEYVREGLYHYYYMGIFLFLTVLGFLDRFSWETARRSFLMPVMIAVLAGGALLNAGQVRRFNEHYLKSDYGLEHWSKLMAATWTFVKQHRNEEDFSFNFFHSDECDLVFISAIGFSENQRYFENFTTRSFFYKYWKDENPKYYLVYLDDHGLFAAASREEARNYLNRNGIKGVTHFRHRRRDGKVIEW